MKKLMIAAAATAMVGGAYATTGCCGDAAEAATPSCNASVYSITINVKGPFATKSVKKNGCTGYYLDNATRTVNGYMWTCCNLCEDPTDGEAWQMTLWDKTAKTALLAGVTDAGAATYEFTASATFTLVNVGTIALTSDQKSSAAAARADLLAKARVLDPTAVLPADDKITIKVIETEAKSVWSDTTMGTFALSFRSGKTATSYFAWGVIPVTAADLDGSYDSGKGNLDSIGLFGGLAFVMNGTWKAKEYRPQSLSGTVLGEMLTAELCDNEWGAFVGECEDFATWCDYAGFGQTIAPVTGTIKATYVNKLSKSLYDTVPAYDRN